MLRPDLRAPDRPANNHMQEGPRGPPDPTPAAEAPDTDTGGEEDVSLPDGACFKRVPNQPGQEDPAPTSARIVARAAEYLGSFPVAGSEQTTRAEYIRTQLTQLRGVSRSRAVLLLVSLAGLKVCSPDGHTVLMAHALRRISFATCDSCLFSFLAREPKGHFALQYCHTFRTTTAQQAEQLSSIVGNAFRMAYAAQLQKHTSPFGQLIVSPPGLTAKDPAWSPTRLQKDALIGECVEDLQKLHKSDDSRSSEEASRGVSPPPPPERSDSLGGKAEEEEKALLAAPWFQAGIPREIALEVLAQEPVGSFMVRESTTKIGCYALSLRVPRDFQPSGIAHYLILRTNRGYRIKGFTKEFSSMMALITHHSVMPELLPCPLSLSRYNPSFARPSAGEADADPDYNTLADFRRMMAELA
ncbi:SH2 domain-containing protein 5-like [Neocloeon triangulifer]|uniref:SH2 domain-containing protein 5-like n=1 Tax=Neocloeon triangulifer TaxID=2078957 RepID=UPI00286F604D|nr:SH2 domain-containing protein 5-like [Neocloeon triangulifer]